MKKNAKKDVLINIRGIYRVEDETDEIEIFTTGQYYKKDDTYYISYDETEATGFEGSHTTLSVAPGRVVLERKGAARSQLIVEQGKRHQCQYDVGFGDMMIGVHGSRIRYDLDEQGGNVEFRYSLDVNSALASQNYMYIYVKENERA
jgi:uncharacterized beta-barrel protein YwiB (DUF1934 family)